MAVRVHRLALEVLADAPGFSGLHRQSFEVAVGAGGANSSAAVRAARLGLEVLADTPVTALLHRQSAEAAVDGDAANAGATIFAHRLAVEVMGDAPSNVALHRQSVEAGILAVFANGTATIFAHRLAVEVLADAPPTVTALALPADFHTILHNWAEVVETETAYSTDVQMAHTVAEKRRGLVGKPYRTVTVSWLAKDREESEALVRTMRAATVKRWAVPLYQDQTPLTAAVGAVPSTTIYCDTTLRRFYVGGHVALVEVDGAGSATGTILLRKVSERFSDRLVLDATVVSLAARRWLVIPLLNAEVMLEPEWEYVTGSILRCRLTFQEVFGRSSLPPAASSLPSGFPALGDLPVFDIEPNYAESVAARLVREGALEPSGRSVVVDTLGDRARYVHDHPLMLEREDFWRLLRFFDSRRGRLLPFLQIDQDQVYQVASFDASGTFVTVTPLGDMADFAAELDYVGVVLSDGTHLVREVVTVQSIFGAWRVTVATPLPAGLLPQQVRRFARARQVRFSEDALREAWVTTNICQTRISTIEVLREDEVAS